MSIDHESQVDSKRLPMKLISWNVNGIRAAIKKGFGEFVTKFDPDVLCLQEIKARPEQVPIPPILESYENFWNPAEKPGYSGTSIFSKTAPLSIRYGMGSPAHDCEGRLITAEYPTFFLVTVYTPNAQNELRRLAYRLDWEEALCSYLKDLERQGKPVILCGDLNVAHQEIDLARPQQNRGSPGFSDEERTAFTKLLDAGFVDSFRHFYPEKTGAYSWWSYRANARTNNVGWRLDYFCLSTSLLPSLQSASILHQIHGSDHCPVEITLAL